MEVLIAMIFIGVLIIYLSQQHEGLAMQAQSQTQTQTATARSPLDVSGHRQNQLDYIKLESCLARKALDKNVPIRPGEMQSVPVDLKTATSVMNKAVDLINKRCGMDFCKLAIDGAEKQSDSFGNVMYCANVHLYSVEYNISTTFNINTLQSPSQKQPYLMKAAPLSSFQDDDSGVQAAPTGAFDVDYYNVDKLV